MEHFIELQNITKIYNKKKVTEFCAIQDLSLTVERGEMIAIVGKSGAGKSTLLNIIGGVDEFEGGTYLFEGQSLAELSQGKMAEFRNRKIGIVLQDFALLENYNVLENVLVPLRLSNRRHSEYRKLAENALKKVGMEDLAKKPVKQLSGGQKQRVAIARAIVNEPAVILADEPTGALDTETSAQILRVFKELNEQGQTVIIITHDMQIANECNRIVAISDGKIIEA